MEPIRSIEETGELRLQFEKRGGLLPAVVQHESTREVLMLGYVNEEAFRETLRSGYATFWSTSRQELWTKGKTSGDLLQLREVLVDCDQDALVYVVRPLGGGACHTRNAAGQPRQSCFYRHLTSDGALAHRNAEDEA
jgi:phosphoribosyl-AMP cyclohydrolase